MCGDGCREGGKNGEKRYRVVGPGRREFLTQAALAAVAAVLATSCGDGEIAGVANGTTPEQPPPVLPTGFTIRIADFPALSTIGGTARVDANTSNPIAVTRTGASSFVALSMICPHAGYKPINIISTGFRCPNHGAVFDSTGNWTGGQRTKDLQSYPTVYTASSGSLTIG
jgi:nitrite reductase/ring-hydroxylating ferredoxin subunit